MMKKGFIWYLLFIGIIAYGSSNRDEQVQDDLSSVQFLAPDPLIDANYYETILNRFDRCKINHCASFMKHFNESNNYEVGNIVTQIGEYTSCIVSCSSNELYKSMFDFKELLEKILQIGSHRLASVRKYIGGTEYYNVIEERTRIGDSCCLPLNAFIPWNKIMISVKLTPLNILYNLTGEDSSIHYLNSMVPVVTYLEYCTKAKDLNSYENTWLDSIHIVCNNQWTSYLLNLQENIGHLILSPHAASYAHSGACSKNLQMNPMGKEILMDYCMPDDVMIDQEMIPQSMMMLPLINGTCNDYHLQRKDNPTQNITFHSVLHEKKHSGYFTVIEGLPNKIHLNGLSGMFQDKLKEKVFCEYKQGLMNDTNDIFQPLSPPKEESLIAVKDCPLEEGSFEYCNMEQYASYLTTQIYDDSKCNVNDMKKNANIPEVYYQNLYCLLRTFSLRCDCMEAVLQCYESQQIFSGTLSKVLGKTASILCGFLLCQRPKIFSLFGGENSIQKAQIMQEILLESGIPVESFSYFSLPTIAFLSFVIGMVVFTISKSVNKIYYTYFSTRPQHIQIDDRSYHEFVAYM